MVNFDGLIGHHFFVFRCHCRCHLATRLYLFVGDIHWIGYGHEVGRLSHVAVFLTQEIALNLVGAFALYFAAIVAGLLATELLGIEPLIGVFAGVFFAGLIRRCACYSRYY